MSSPRTSLTPESKREDTLCERLTESAGKVISFLETRLQKDGSYGPEAKDIACYFKSPMLFIIGNKTRSAGSVLKYIQEKFMFADGDFKTSSDAKSANDAYIEYWSYINGWIVRAAQQLGYADISQPGYNYLKQYNLGADAGFLTNDIKLQSGITDVLTVAHHGLINLEIDRVDVAISAGNYLCKAISEQPNLKSGFYLRFNKQGQVITQFTKAQSTFNFVSTTEPNQLHFMIGYPSAYLALLYKKTKNKTFLNAAQAYLDFSLSCNEQMYQCNFSHKIAWAASLVYECTGDEKYLGVVERIANHFIANQKNGMWYVEDINSSYDQSAEIACWFLDIAKNIHNRLKKNVKIDEAKQIKLSQRSLTTKVIKYSVMGLVAGLGMYAFYRSRTNGNTISHPEVLPLTSTQTDESNCDLGFRAF